MTVFVADSVGLAHQERYTQAADVLSWAPRMGGDEPAMDLSSSEDRDPDSGLSFGRRLRRARMQRRWTQLQLARRMGEVAAKHGGTAGSRSLIEMISKWENGIRKPSQYNMHLLAAALDVDVASLGLPVDPDFFW
ncbi:helix-turn-helix transcriptional regulator [Actinoplanes oblitus]|uniref:Helix-turn-helix transcriptional regulator n=1 Tax=Actinoplanes oblitus TaxID=3040509 RepID=A0ABY8WRA8_9ACTN|nr:helix-turn-helix transcriptional regulator [Actinoplanes oblitus]WIM99977.1 helix-turn-helix transcriptional regulator [Actinoplanes oblitus]